MTIKITCSAAVAKALSTTASLSDIWGEAYAAIAGDVARGATYREISDALKKDGSKVSPTVVGDYALAARLTVYGKDYDSALVTARTKKKSDGTLVPPVSLMFAHSIITGARNSRGMGYVRGALDSLDAAISESDTSADAVRKILADTLRDLLAEKRAEKKDKKDDTPDTPDTEDQEPGEETVTPEPVTPDAVQASLSEVLVAAAALLAGAERRLTAGETVTAAERDAFMARASRVAGLLRADSAVAV